MCRYGTEFEQYTNHKPLETIYASRSKPCARIERWILPCNHTSKVYVRSAENTYPLSRLSQAEGPAKPSSAHKISDDFTKFVAVTATPKL